MDASSPGAVDRLLRRSHADTGAGTNVVQDPSGAMVLFERGQVLVVSACDSRTEFMRKRRRIEAFAARMADALQQEAVFVLAFPSDSFLVEGAIRPKRKGKKP